MKTGPLKVLLVVSGFPTDAQPSRGVFNFRAAQNLREFATLEILYLRAWKPGRRFLSTAQYEGFSITTAALPQLPRSPQINPIIYQRLGWRLLSSRIKRFDLLHSVDVWNAIPASYWGSRAGVHHVAQVIGSDVNSMLPREKSRWGVKGWNHHAHGVACNSRALCQAFLGLYPRMRNVKTVYRGVDLDLFHPTGPAEGPLANCRPVRFLFLGGFNPYPMLPHRGNTKGGETLLRAWQMAEKTFDSNNGPFLLLAGPAVSDNPALERWRASLEFPTRVHIQGVVRPTQVPGFIRAADVLLIPSMEEGLPNVGMEASACGRAVFGSSAGGIPEIIVDQRTGLVLPAGDWTAWATALATYGKQLQPLRGMGDFARKHMETSFDRGQFAPKMIELYETVRGEPLDSQFRN